MFYKNIIFDLDNTLYNYNLCHNNAINKVFSFISNEKNCNIDLVKESYNEVDKTHKALTINTASSHNKYIKIKQLLDKYNMTNYPELHNLYWTTFFLNMKPFEGVIDFIKWNKSLDINIGVLTDYETEYQIEKLKRLDLYKYIDCIVTSEEIGCEKPSVHSFNYVLMKMSANREETVMIGDSFEKDINGAKQTGIYSYHFCKKYYKINKFFTEFNSFLILYEKFKEIHKEIYNLKIVSRYCGERFDLVQAGGGNTSVKINDIMFIKASGFKLADIAENTGYVCINNRELLNDLSNNAIKKITDYNMYGKLRGSIETFMHSILKKYTVHLHPIQVNKILVMINSKKIINTIFPESLFIEYITPGIKVHNEIKKKYNNEEIIFLDNHGVIITSDNFDNIKKHLDYIINKCEDALDWDSKVFKHYKETNKISSYILKNYDKEVITYLSEDKKINRYFRGFHERILLNGEFKKNSVTFPDALIYCGIKPVYSYSGIQAYYKNYNELPKNLAKYDEDGSHAGTLDGIYIISNTLKKCKEIEDVLKANLLIIDTERRKQYLSQDEICFLNNWDAEKYRKFI